VVWVVIGRAGMRLPFRRMVDVPASSSVLEDVVEDTSMQGEHTAAAEEEPGG